MPTTSDFNTTEAVRALQKATVAYLKAATRSFTVSNDPAEIKGSVDALCELLREWKARDGIVSDAIGTLIRLVQGACVHGEAQRGYNSLDGGWVCCPVCRMSK